MDNFETRSVIRKDTKDFKRHLRRPQDKIVFLACSLGFLTATVRAVISQNTMLAFVGVAGLILVSLMFFRDELVSRKMWERIKETTGAEELNMIVTFLDDKIKTYYPESAQTLHIDYHLISRFEETESTYLLITNARQFVMVNKETLIQDGKDEEFLQFIKNKCSNVKWGK